MAEELKPCPFCGCSMRLESNHDWHRIVGDHSAECVFLDSETMMVPDIEDQREIAIADWNARAVPAGHVVVSAADLESLRKDKARLDAIEDNCWDVRYGISSNADAGDSSISIEIVGRYQGVPHIRVLGENYTENLRAAIDQAMTAEACPPERPEYDDHGRPLRALLSEQEGGNDVSNHQ
ncbi:Lar family restriction alleviation protein [Pseudomonas aeruginosa]|uniref:Lar family restriction alleviation protein n=1 Tax=Pseudomonas aeruginosa TaxID=287 RepID=UPI000313F52B|nr:Lar family restriction alleviation protein [Pseudomonas aeruginosa]EMB4100930.1 Lar family restriction alleviation protein [Pseudomonas aeruginosa]ERY01415.1 hypothetical protein Q077_05223 [Pseudomonas aeruginosa BL23]MCG3012000.1 Lar family restriction alleviation protein [Pseudomonas aeruginosa]MCO2507537.1 hypothetical protein [Pseudomonas aeruginosa]MDI4076550.1 Lar family restriction alleviation protein [Pseudomonas aeruginosa]